MGHVNKGFVIATLLLAATMLFAQSKPQCTKPTPVPPPVVTPTPVPVAPTPVTTVTNTNSNTNSNSNNNTSNSTSTSTSNSTANSNQTQSQQQSQTATGGNAVVNDGQQRQAPAVGIGLIVPTASCLGAFSAGGSIVGGGIGFGGSKRDKECSFVRLANELIALGNLDGAAKVLCATQTAKQAHLTIDDCRSVVKPPVPVAPISVTPPSVTVPIVVLPAPVTVLPAPPEYRTEITVHAPKPAVKKPAAKKPVRRLPPDCQNVTTVVCATHEK